MPISQGSFEIGIDGDYDNWYLWADALDAGLTDDMSVTAISAFNSPTRAQIDTLNLNGHTLTIDGAGFLTTAISSDAAKTCIEIYNITGLGTVNVKNLNMIATCDATTSPDTWFEALLTISVLGNVDQIYNIQDCKFNCNNYKMIGITINAEPTFPYINISNVIAINSSDRHGFYIYGSSDNLIIENCNAINNGGSNFYKDLAGTFKACILRNCTAYNGSGYVNFNFGHATLIKCASSDTSGSETILRNRSFNNDFIDDIDYLPNETGILINNGVNPIIPGHTKYYNDVVIVNGEVDIGANGVDKMSSSSSSSGGILSTIKNSIIISYNNNDIDFSIGSASDLINNCLSYNYGAGDLDLSATSKIDCIENEGPQFVEVSIDERLFNIDLLMSYDFVPKITSPIVNNGDNSFMSGIDVDIIGNNRIYDNGIVDIGPYELETHKKIFEPNSIQSIFQDKLTIDYANKKYIPTKGDKTYNDLWYQFTNNPEDREDFVRESKIIIELKNLDKGYKLLTDKQNTEIGSVEAYFDSGTYSIIISKSNNLLGKVWNDLFSGRYVFYFDESVHLLRIYLNDTYSKGLSGNRNPIKNVKIGGSSIVNK